ncbi:hypothetical protein ACWDG9_16340 [Streptomyces sp. NPDC001073]
MTPHSGPASSGSADHSTRHYPGAISSTDAITRGRVKGYPLLVGRRAGAA